MLTAKFHGTVYEVKPTAKVTFQKAIRGYDINGHLIEKPENIHVHLGLFDNGHLVYTLGIDNETVYHRDTKLGGVKVRDTETDPYAHKITDQA